MAPPRRTLYFNDLRHWYLYAQEPETFVVTSPVDEVAGTGVTTFVGQVDGGSGLWYPSKVGTRHLQPSEDDGRDRGSYGWRAWTILKQLDAAGVDLLEANCTAALAMGR